MTVQFGPLALISQARIHCRFGDPQTRINRLALSVVETCLTFFSPRKTEVGDRLLRPSLETGLGH